MCAEKQARRPDQHSQGSSFLMPVSFIDVAQFGVGSSAKREPKKWFGLEGRYYLACSPVGSLVCKRACDPKAL